MVAAVSDAAAVTRAATGMGIATAASRALGCVRILTIAAVLGTTYLGNAYQSSNAVSNVLFELLAAGALSAVLVPTFVDYFDRGDQDGAQRVAGHVLGIALVALAGVVIVGVVAAPWIARVLTSGVADPAIAARQRALSTFLLRFFVPQILLYAVGAVAVAVLYAQRRLAVTAMAPVGLTVVVTIAMVVFRVLAGADPGLSLSLDERLVLAAGGTLGVAAFVAVPTVALWRGGFRLVPRPRRPDTEIRDVLRLSSWAVLQHTLIGVLLASAIVVGNTVEGGTIAYQVAWVFFLAPYAVLAQPIHTAILPDLARARDEPERFAASLRWTLDSMAVLVVPVTAAVLAVALPLMHVVAFGQATRAGGVGLLAAALASLTLGLFAYSAFLLFARAYYALGDSRTPALAALGSAGVGVTVMAVGGVLTNGPSTVAVLGFGHSVAYTVGAIALGTGLARRSGHSIAPRGLGRAIAVAAPIGFAAWLVARGIDPVGRLANLGLVAGVVIAGGTLYVLGIRAWGIAPHLHLTPASTGGALGTRGAGDEPTDIGEIP